MAYAVPPYWTHFATQIAESPTPTAYNVPSAALMNRYSDGQNEINTRMGSYAINMAVGQITDPSWAIICHRMPWLHYREAGTLTDINGANEITLSAEDNTYAVYNLDTISWMLPGTLYQVTGCVMAAESTDP